MLTEQEIEEIESEAAKVPVRRAACIEALKIVQQHRGYISDENLQDIANYMEMSSEDLDSVATFYNLIYRKPVGRNIILLCDSISCYVMGYERLHDYINERLHITFGETTPDGRFTLLPNCCLGICDHAPSLMVNNELYKDVTREKLNEILHEYK
jgi:NADH-quinone oxidoreductase subunit E